METLKQFGSITKDLPTRLGNLAKYAPFFELYRLNTRSDKYTELDMSVLSMSVLSYLLYEGHLKDRGLSFEQIKYFIEQVVEAYYKVSYNAEEWTELTRYVLDKVQNGGKPFSYRYYDVEKSEWQEKQVRYIAYTRDAKLERNLYRLTSTGVDFFLQTKEFGEESKISIQLILLRKLVDHEDFGSALHALDNINIEIKKEAKRKNEILEELSYGFTEGYEIYTARVRQRLEDEQALFKETIVSLENLEKSYMRKIERNQITEKELKFKRFVVDMHMALNQTVELHALLLDTLVDLRQKAEEILIQKRRNIFKENFNFHHFLEGAMKQDDVTPLTGVLDSLFGLHVPKRFGLERIDHLLLWKESQSPQEEIVVSKQKAVMPVVTLDEKISSRVCFNYELMLRELLFLLKDQQSVELEAYLTHLTQRYGEQVVENYDLAPFLIALSEQKGRASSGKSFKLDEIIRQDYKAYELEALYQKIILETSSLEIFQKAEMISEVIRGEYIQHGPLEMTNCRYYIKR